MHRWKPWVKGEGTCSYEAQRGFPKQPKKKMICAKGVCILAFLSLGTFFPLVA